MLKRCVSFTLVIVLIVGQMMWCSGIAEVFEPNHPMFIVDEGLSEEEYSAKKAEFARGILSSNGRNQVRSRNSMLSTGNSANGFSLNGNTLSNNYVEFAVDPAKGRFTVGTVEGNPGISSDDHKIMLYGHNRPWSSYTTVHVNGSSYIYGDSGFKSSPHFDGNANYSETQYGNITVQQIISIEKNSSTHRDDIVEIKYIAKNTGSSDVAFGLRIMLDTMLGNNDAAPFKIPGLGDLTTEKEFIGNAIPQYWQAFDSLNNPNVVSHGNFVSVPIRPTKVQFTNWSHVYNTPWDYHVSEGSANGDSAVSIIWEKTLRAGAQEEYISRYGLSELLQDLQPPLGVTIASGGSILTNSTNDAYLPYTITVYIQNIGTATANNVTCRIKLPEELAFVDSKETGLIHFDSMNVGAVKTIEKTVFVKKTIPADTKTSFQVSVSADNTATKNLTKEIWIKALKQNTSEKTGTFKYGGQINGKKDSSATYYYADSYFDDGTGVYNPQLATMSLCLELSAWTSLEAKTNNIIDRDKNGEPVYETDWPNATINARTLLQEIGFESFEQNEYWSRQPEMHSLGAVAAYKNIGEYTVVALAIRGGGYADEWGGNFILGRSGNHLGFEKGRDEALRFLNAYVVKHKANFNSELKLWVVGYSRGGAVANMTAGKLVDVGSCGGMQLKPENIFAYTFEAPQGFVNMRNEKQSKYQYIQNQINSMDIVPYVAPSVMRFQRYNINSNMLIASLGKSSYDDIISDIQKQFTEVRKGIPRNGIEPGKDIENYDPNAYAMKIDIGIDIESISIKWIPTHIPFVRSIPLIAIEANPYWKSRDKELPIDVMLEGTMDSVFSGISNGRDGYVDNIENALSHLITFFMGYNHKIIWSEVINSAFFDNYAEGTRQILGILLYPFASNTQKALDAAKTAAELISDAALKQTGTNLDEVLSALVNVLKACFESTMDDPQQFFGFLYYLCADKGILAHFPEITLAAVMAQDSNYNKSYSSRSMPQSYRMVKIDCPVDVHVYDENNQLISQIVNENVTNTLSNHGASITKTGTKQVILPSDKAYNIQIRATDNGEMSVSVLEYDDVLNQFTLVMGYQNIQIHKDESYRVVVPEYILEDYHDEDGDGSSSHYRLFGPQGKEIAPTTKQKGDEIEYYHVTVSSNNKKGIVTGGGRFVATSFAQVHASPFPTVDFLGWYDNNDKLVSTEKVYRFPVNQNLNLTAQFSEGSFHKLSVSATKGGRVNINEIELPEGVNVQLIAEPEENYKFEKWEYTSGKIQDEKAATTMFAMPANNSSVTAIFALNGPPSFDDVAVPSDSFSFKKIWEGDNESSIDFTLYKQGGEVYHHAFNKKIISKSEWQYNAWFSSPVACYIIETPIEGYITRYKNVGVYAEITDRCCDGGIIINKKIPRTGDSFPLGLWIVMVLLGLSGIGMIMGHGKHFKAKH